jgi:polyhydroxyalkanoate synthesis repressor PhaR
MGQSLVRQDGSVLYWMKVAAFGSPLSSIPAFRVPNDLPGHTSVSFFRVMRTIKRYSNRKLYDTTERHYVTLADVAGFVRKGDDIQVTDYVTNSDLTAQTLAQIIFEEEKKTPRVGADILRKIIQTGIAA